MTQHQTKIDGYDVTLGNDMDGDDIEGESNPDRVTGCWVTYKGEHDQFHASLACLIDTGTLTAPSGREWEVPYKTIDKIEDWSIEHGY